MGGKLLKWLPDILPLNVGKTCEYMVNYHPHDMA